MSSVALAIVSEPDPRVRQALRVELSHADWTVLVANDADEVEYLAAKTAAQMIVLDVSTIKLRGYSACARIRRQTGYQTRPIILTAANVETRDAAAAGTAGATALLAKPYSVSRLFQVVRSRLAVNDPLHAALPIPSEQIVDWGTALHWSFGASSGLRHGGHPMPVVAGPSARIPLKRVT
ncbi:MAG TPA: response regulator [Rhodopila sp.]|jgi:DNA-binding response OmpR family regulator|nr:response regulator [Rhodopila sp.]